ncbi:DUF465 domain-containing protein [Pseudooceanicola sp. CBS1P-1]|uniref:DUF465 domain-containing protein n=1 Tax=Pseudooceanicola albus TaxID=2692189 RepID=A0A6L7G2J0_9RHOB|nr:MULTISPECIES: DUF465 domain-containing protein [Pseudooceanicola]MBT9384604.1 DUF465 domain-containing protein [Pseudooceanicola endophyticus]MXN18305.1 DUF465 domain-containing protein [Pseudooceanicola albus]
MAHRPHALVDDFPAHGEAIAALKAQDPHFLRMAEEYDALNDRIHRWECNIEPMEDLAMIEARKQRASLKDRIWAGISALQLTS